MAKERSYMDLAGHLDALESIDSDCIGDHAPANSKAITDLEDRLMSTPGTCAASFAWRFARLDRAIDNNWREEVLRPLVDSLRRDAVTMAARQMPR